MYIDLLTIGLILAVLANLYDIKSMGLCFVSIAFLLLIPGLVPETLGTGWFPIMAGIEVLFAICANLTRSPVRHFIILACAYNVLCHLVAYISYEYSLSLYNSYQFWLRVGEISQVLALILGSRPVTALVVLSQLKRKEDKDEDDGYRFSASSG